VLDCGLVSGSKCEVPFDGKGHGQVACRGMTADFGSEARIFPARPNAENEVTNRLRIYAMLLDGLILGE
jgi:hypothetical protein